MQPVRNIKAFAKKLVELSFDGGFVSEERVKGILTALRESPPKNHRRTLQFYMIKLRSAIRQSEAVMEFCGEIHDSTLLSLKKDLELYYKRNLKIVLRENDDLLAGFRIFVGDDIWDASLAGRIEKISESF